MSKLVLGLLTVAGLMAASPSLAASTFLNTCSNTHFAWSDSNEATIRSTCLRDDGKPHSTTLVLQGISNKNGVLTQGTGPSTFQARCGSIEVKANSPSVMLSAYCRSYSGASTYSELPLNNIHNDNGNLAQRDK